MVNDLVYVASPFTHDKQVMIQRFEDVVQVTLCLMNEGHQVYSPIAAGWPLAQRGELPTDWVYWESYCKTFVSRCQLLVVAMIEGWLESTGVTAEIEYARELGIPVKYFCLRTMRIIDDFMN